MASNQNIFDHGGPIPRPNVQTLVECLRTGRIDLPTAVGQISLFIRETLKAIEDYSDEQCKLNLERKTKVDKMNKVINELSEKCQGMQQALLYKEEKYDEKCREAERYKVICELSAKAAVKDHPLYDPCEDQNNNNITSAFDVDYKSGELKDSFVKMEMNVHNELPTQELTKPARRNLKSHLKLSQSQLNLGHSLNRPRADSPRSCYETSLYNDPNDDDRRSTMSQIYVGGPSKRKIPLVNNSKTLGNSEMRTRERLETIGGINVSGPPINTGPVASGRLMYRQINRSFDEDSSKRVKVDLTSQRNEMMSSSGDVVRQMKQKFVEKDLHKQVAGGCWTRLASRRKKDWPF